MKTPENLKYSKEHEWVRTEGDEVVVGVTDFAQSELTDIVFVEVPEVGREVKKGDAIAVLESVKAVSDVYSPVSGTVTAANDELSNSPELINTDPYEAGWIVKIKLRAPAEVDELMSADQYIEFLKG